jgi:maltoporin
MIKFNGKLYDLEQSFERKMLHEDLDQEFYETYEEPTEEAEEDLQEAHQLISAQDLNSLDKKFVGFDIQFELIEDKNMIVEALKAANYHVEESNVSRSIYAINDDGNEVRVSDHKRPSFQANGAVGYIDHQYDNELIVSDNKVTKSDLIKFGFSRLGLEEFYLG